MTVSGLRRVSTTDGYFGCSVLVLATAVIGLFSLGSIAYFRVTPVRRVHGLPWCAALILLAASPYWLSLVWWLVVTRRALAAQASLLGAIQETKRLANGLVKITYSVTQDGQPMSKNALFFKNSRTIRLHRGQQVHIACDPRSPRRMFIREAYGEEPNDGAT